MRTLIIGFDKMEALGTPGKGGFSKWIGADGGENRPARTWRWLLSAVLPRSCGAWKEADWLLLRMLASAALLLSLLTPGVTLTPRCMGGLLSDLESSFQPHVPK